MTAVTNLASIREQRRDRATRLLSFPPSQLTVSLVAGALLSALVAQQTSRAFSIDHRAWPAVVSALGAAVLIGAVRKRAWHWQVVAGVLCGPLGGALAVWVAKGSLPGDVARAFTEGLGDIVSSRWPAPPTPPSTALLAIVTTWASAGTAVLVLRRWAAGALVPPLAIVGLTALLAADAGAPSVAVLCGIALLSLLVLQSGRATPHSMLSVLHTCAVLLVVALVPFVTSDVLPSGRYDPRSTTDAPSLAANEVSPLARLDEWRSLPTDDVLFSTSDPTPATWRLVGLLRYDGTSWQPADDYRRSSTVVNPPSGDVDQVDIDVQIGALDAAWLPMLDETIDVVPPAGRQSELQVDGTSSALLPVIPPVLGDTYSIVVEPRVVQPAQARNAGFASGGGAFVDGFEVSPEIQQLAGRLVAGASTDYQRAAGIATYLREQFSLDPESPPGHSIAVLDSFINRTRRGRDEQFVAAYGLLAGAAGLPVRIVVGFDTVVSADGSGTVALASTAKAWPEVEFDGVGWVPFDPIPSSVDDAGTSLGGGAVAPIDDAVLEPPPTTIAPTTQSTVPGDADGSAPPISTDEPLSTTTKVVIAAITAVVLLAATYVGLVLYLKRRRRHRRATHPDPNQRTVGAFLDGVDFMVDLGAPLKRSATDIELVGIASRAVGGTVTLLEPVAELSTAAVYDRTPSSDVDADDAWHTVDQFEDHTSQQLGTVRLWRSRLSTRSLRRGIGS
jgi:hypothetical protein